LVLEFCVVALCNGLVALSLNTCTKCIIKTMSIDIKVSYLTLSEVDIYKEG